jgi:hypothetical protein
MISRKSREVSGGTQLPVRDLRGEGVAEWQSRLGGRVEKDGCQHRIPSGINHRHQQLGYAIDSRAWPFACIRHAH